jgi:hypothetical protein
MSATQSLSVPPQVVPLNLNLEMESQLNLSRIAAATPRRGEALMAQLIAPEGIPDIICRLSFAMRWCAGHSDWKFETL